MLNCTMPKCRAKIHGWTGLDELLKIRQHFSRKHHYNLATDEAAEVRLAMEEGREPKPELLRVMLNRPGV